MSFLNLFKGLVFFATLAIVNISNAVGDDLAFEKLAESDPFFHAYEKAFQKLNKELVAIAIAIAK